MVSLLELLNSQWLQSVSLRRRWWREDMWRREDTKKMYQVRLAHARAIEVRILMQIVRVEVCVIVFLRLLNGVVFFRHCRQTRRRQGSIQRIPYLTHSSRSKEAARIVAGIGYIRIGVVLLWPTQQSSLNTHTCRHEIYIHAFGAPCTLSEMRVCEFMAPIGRFSSLVVRLRFASERWNSDGKHWIDTWVVRVDAPSAYEIYGEDVVNVTDDARLGADGPDDDDDRTTCDEHAKCSPCSFGLFVFEHLLEKSLYANARRDETHHRFEPKGHLPGIETTIVTGLCWLWWHGLSCCTPDMASFLAMITIMLIVTETLDQFL